MTTEYLLDELAEKNAEIAELKAKVNYLESTISGKAPDIRNLPQDYTPQVSEIAMQSLASVKADAVESILNLDYDCETSNSDVAYSTTTIQEYANILRGETK